MNLYRIKDHDLVEMRGRDKRRWYSERLTLIELQYYKNLKSLYNKWNNTLSVLGIDTQIYQKGYQHSIITSLYGPGNIPKLWIMATTPEVMISVLGKYPVRVRQCYWKWRGHSIMLLYISVSISWKFLNSVSYTLPKHLGTMYYLINHWNIRMKYPEALVMNTDLSMLIPPYCTVSVITPNLMKMDEGE